MRKTALLLLLGAVLLTACNPGVDTAFIPPSNLVAVSAALSPQDTLLAVYLYRGQPLGKVLPEEQTVERNATVELSDGTRTVRLTYQPARLRYERPAAALPILAGNAYFLTVKTADGIALKSQCRVPPAVTDLRIAGTQQPNDFEFEITWTAPPDQPFAWVRGRTASASTTGPNFSGNVRFDGTGGPDFVRAWLTDQQRGGRNTLTGRVLDAARRKPLLLNIEVLNLEPALHRFLVDTRDLNNFNANTDGFIPTFREPRPVASNVEGGVGIFAAYNRSETVLMIP